jgi:hypothetical protein
MGTKRGTDGVDVSNGTNSTSVNVSVVTPKLKLKNILFFNK